MSTAIRGASRTGGATTNALSRLDVTELDNLVGKYFTKGLAESTHRSYNSAQRRYLDFCSRARLHPLPATETGLCYFVAYLAKEKLKHRTIKAYLSAVCFLHIEEQKPDPFLPSLTRLQYVLRGVKRCESQEARPPKERLPISPNLLKCMKKVWNSDVSIPNRRMLWAACCVAFFGLLRIRKMVAPSRSAYDPSVHLSLSDVSMDEPRRPTTLKISIKQSKTDPFRKGVDLFLGKTDTDICPVRALLNYLVQRGTAQGPLIMLEDGSFLTRQYFVSAVRDALQRAGIDQSKYCGHSFQIGAATTAAARGMEDSVIKTLGRWQSVAYLQYVRIPRNQLAAYSRLLCSEPQ